MIDRAALTRVREFVEGQEKHVVDFAEPPRSNPAGRLCKQRLLVGPVAANDPVLGVLAVPDEGSEQIDLRFSFCHLDCPVRQLGQLVEDRPFGIGGRLEPRGDAPFRFARRKVVDVRENQRHQRLGRLRPPDAGDVDFARTTHAIAVEVPLHSGRNVGAAGHLRDRRQQSGGIPDYPRAIGRIARQISQKGHDLVPGSDQVCQIEEVEPHLGNDVVGCRLRERIGETGLPKPLQQMLVQPRRRVVRGGDRLGALGTKERGLQSFEIASQELKQLGPRST